MYFEMASPDSNNEWGTKFVLRHVDTDDSWFYFMNRRKHSPHWSFTQAIGCNDDYPSHSKLGNIFYRPAQFSPSGEVGYFLFNVELDPDREQEAEDYYTAIGKAYQHLVQGMPILEGNLGFITMSNAEKELIRDNQALFDALSFPVTELENLAQGGFLSLNPGETFGREPRDLPVTYDPKGQIANRFEPPVMPTTYIIRLGDAPDKPDPKGFINLSKKLLGGD